jgi:hypothetical protein
MSKSRPVVETLTEAFRGSLQCLQDSILIYRDSDSSYPFLIIIIIIIIINIIINIIIIIIIIIVSSFHVAIFHLLVHFITW